MKKVLAILAMIMLPVTGAFGQTAAQSDIGFLLAQGSTYGSYTCPAAATMPCFVQYGSTVPVSGSLTPAGTQDVNVKQIGGTTTLTGTGATGAGSERVTVATDSATVAGSATLPAGANIVGKVGIDQTTPGTTNAVSTNPGSRTLVTLDVKTVTTGGTAVTALTAGHRTAGGFLYNPIGATINLCINEIGTATGTTSSGDTTCIQPGQAYKVAPASTAVSVITSDSSHPFSGYGLN